MWFLAEFLERYTRNIARSVMRVAAAEMEANQRAISGIGLARDRNAMILPERSANVPAHAVSERRAAPVAAEVGPLSEKPVPVRAPATKTLITMETMPVGVRGDLVMRYIEQFSEAASAEAGELIDRLGKDKKIRIAELQLIVADVLGEPVTRRTKTEHCDALAACLAPHMLSEASSQAMAGQPELRAN